MDRAALKTALKRYGFSDNDPLDEWVNAARNELVSDLPLSVLDAQGSFTTLSGVADITSSLPADFFKVVSLADVTNPSDRVDLDYVDYREFVREYPDSDSTGDPTIYSVRNLNNVVVWPTPTSSRNWSLLYMKLPAELTADGQSPSEIPPTFHYVIVFRAAAIALMAENEEERAQTAMTEYATGVDKIARAYNQRQAGRFTGVQDTQGYFH